MDTIAFLIPMYPNFGKAEVKLVTDMTNHVGRFPHLSFFL
jgi:hypothetical protein